MRSMHLFVLICAIAGSTAAEAQQAGSCANLTKLRIDKVEITSAVLVPAGPSDAKGFDGRPVYTGALPTHCRVDGVINRRKGVDGVEYGIGFALALPDNWNGDFMMQGGGGGNGIIWAPIGVSYAGKTPALVRGFAVASTDTGHKAKTGSFDFAFMRDQQAYLDFAYLANAEVAGISKQIIADYYSKPAAYSYFAGCSTGGREGMILSQVILQPSMESSPAIRPCAPACQTSLSASGSRPLITRRLRRMHLASPKSTNCSRITTANFSSVRC